MMRPSPRDHGLASGPRNAAATGMRTFGSLPLLGAALGLCILTGCGARRGAPIGVSHAPYTGRPAYLVVASRVPTAQTPAPQGAAFVEDVPLPAAPARTRAGGTRAKNAKDAALRNAKRPGIAISDLRRGRSGGGAAAESSEGGELTVALPEPRADAQPSAEPGAAQEGGGVVLPLVNGGVGTTAAPGAAPTQPGAPAASTSGTNQTGVGSSTNTNPSPSVGATRPASPTPAPTAPIVPGAPPAR